MGNVLRRHGLSPAPKRKQTVSWKDFIRSHRDVLVGMDFFSAEVLTLKGLLTYYVLFFIHLETRRVSLVGFTPSPDQDHRRALRNELLLRALTGTSFFTPRINLQQNFPSEMLLVFRQSGKRSHAETGNHLKYQPHLKYQAQHGHFADFSSDLVKYYWFYV